MARFVLGFMGSSSTFAFMAAGRSGDAATTLGHGRETVQPAPVPRGAARAGPAVARRGLPDG